MTTDARGHTVPAASDHPQRQNLLDMSLSICDVVPVTNTTTRATAASALSPSTSKPLIVFRADAPAYASLEVTTDGSTWRSIPLATAITTDSPTLGGSTTAPTLGTGSSTTRTYQQIGARVVAHGEFAAGTSGTAVGSGLYEVPLPIATALPTGSIIGNGTYFDSSAGTWTPFEVRTDSSTTARMQPTAATNTSIASNNPGIGANDKIDYALDYLIATS